MQGASVPEGRLPSSQRSRPFPLPPRLDSTDHFVNLGAAIFVGKAGVIQISFVCLGAITGRIHETRTILAESLQECARIAIVFGASTLIAGIERSVATIRSEVRPVPEWHHSKHTQLNPKFACWVVPLQQMQFFEPLKNPEGEIDFDAKRI